MEKILEVYRKNRSMYTDFTHEMQDVITAFLMKNNIRIHSIVSRTKAEHSLKNKIDKKKYTSLDEITDLCGIRIITYFADDVDSIANILQNSLVIDQVNSVDKRKLLPATQFGYLSLHFVAGLPTSLLRQPRYEKFASCKVEIQICSILQHAWAEIEHDLEYKTQTAVSYNVRRRFSRLAGLLEFADEEFVMLRKHLQPSPVPSCKPISLPALAIPKSAQAITVFEKLRGKLGEIRNLRTKLNNKIDSSTFKFGSACTAFGMILAILITHFISLSHLSSVVTAALSTEKHMLVSLVGSYTV